MKAGQSFTSNIQTIDAYAASEVRKRYGPKASTTRPDAVSQSILERATQDGLYADIESRKEAALSAHMATLSQTLSAAQISQLQAYIRQNVSPKIVIGTLNKGALKPGLPPGVVRGTTKAPR